MRTASRLLAFLLGLAVVAIGALVAIESSLLATSHDSWLVPRGKWNAELLRLHWDDTSVTVACVLLALLGTGLLLLQVLPRPPVRLKVEGTPHGREVWISRRGLEGQLARLADQDPDVLAPTVRLTKRTAKVRAGFPTHAKPNEVGARLRAMADGRLAQAELERPLKVNVRMRPARRRVS